MKKKDISPACPCGGLPAGATYAQCCGRYHDFSAAAPDPEHLMRSRYSAYALGLSTYVLATWHPLTRPDTLFLDAPGTPHATRWLGLTVNSFTQVDDDHATVGFTARYRDAGRAQRMTELSRFKRDAQRWFYVDGDVT